jgi:hypothetical protein
MDIVSPVINYQKAKRDIDNEIYSRIKDFIDIKPSNENFKQWNNHLLTKIITVKKPEKSFDDFEIQVPRFSIEFYKTHIKPKTLDKFQEVYNIFINSHQFLKNYFVDLSVIVLYIDENNKTKENIDKLKNRMSKDELTLLFYHLPINIDESCKKILEKYKFFENINYNDLYYENGEYQSDNGIYLAQDILSKYDNNIFGKSINLPNYQAK